MQNLTEIKKENIRDVVMSQIRKSKKEILATMDMTEELSHPLPTKYFSLLHQKYKKGIKIKRIIFGSTKQYQYFLKKELEIRKDFILLLIINILNNIKNILTGFKPFPLQKCPRGFLPRPLLRAGFSPRRISKTLAEVLQNPFPRK